MEIKRGSNRLMFLLLVFLISFILGITMAKSALVNTYAEGEDTVFEDTEEHFVTFYDDGAKLTVKTNARTVKEALDKAGYEISSGDIV